MSDIQAMHEAKDALSTVPDPENMTYTRQALGFARRTLGSVAERGKNLVVDLAERAGQKLGDVVTRTQDAARTKAYDA